jgi:hypothetical protein
MRELGLATLLVLAFGCEGEMGPQGEMGAAGQMGEMGEPGTANVSHSDWFSLDAYTNKVKGTIIQGTTEALNYRFEAPAITLEILETGSVQFFLRQLSDGETVGVLPLPITSYSSLNVDVPHLGVGTFTLRIYTPGVTPVSDVELVEDLEIFRYVVIPSGAPL